MLIKKIVAINLANKIAKALSPESLRLHGFSMYDLSIVFSHKPADFSEIDAELPQ